VSEAAGRQSRIEVFTMLLGDDSLFYALAE
jgi:hypothetical protein